MESYDSDPSVTNSSSSSAVLTSLPVPRTKYHPSPTHQEAPESLLPAFNQLLNDKENMLQPGRSFVTPNSHKFLPPRIIGSTGASEPLHLIIGGESEESAEGYAIPPLGEDFLLGSQMRMPPYQTHILNSPSENLQPRPLDTPRRPQHFEHPLKRRSAEIPPVFVPTSPVSSFPIQQLQPSVWSDAEAAKPESGTGSILGHRRSSSYGNQPQLWTGITQQQSMPCISNLPGQASSSHHFGE